MFLKVLVFRSNIFSENSQNQSDNYDLESPSSSSTCGELSKLGTSLSSSSSMPMSCLLDSTTIETFGDKKFKKRSSSTSSCSSSSNNLKNSESCGDSEILHSKLFNGNKENFTTHALDMKCFRDEMPAAIFNVTFKFLNTETRLLRKILLGHGMQEAAHDATDFNLLWTGNVLKPDMLRSLSSYQRINHFPRSSELTRKDRLYKNIERMQHFRGFKHFDFIPQTFLLPADYKV